MPELAKKPRYKIGDKVRTKSTLGLVGTVTEARGTYRNEGHVLYTVRVPMSAEPLMMVFREEEIEKVETP